MTKPKFPEPETIDLPAWPDKVSGPKGIGRPKGGRGRTTLIMKDAMSAVYLDLQAESGRENGHFLNWARDHPTDFYKMCMKLLPLQIDTRIDGPMIGTVVFVSTEQMDELDA